MRSAPWAAAIAAALLSVGVTALHTTTYHAFTPDSVGGDHVELAIKHTSTSLAQSAHAASASAASTVCAKLFGIELAPAAPV